MKILFLTPYPLKEAPSQRFRFEHFLEFIEEKGIKWDFQSFISTKAWALLYIKGKSAYKLLATVTGYFRRLVVLFKLRGYQLVFIHRELTPFGPPLFEFIIARILKKKIIYDFDDAIWLPDQQNENFFWKTIKWRSKVASICRWSWKVSAGNEYLADFARISCDQVTVFPTVVDTDIHTPVPGQRPTANGQQPVLGWTGSHSTLPYLDLVLPALQQLEKRVDFQFLVIANRNPHLPLKNFKFIPWKKETEVEDLAQIAIGIMPLPDDEWSRGKCGFKLIQYLALGIPAVASPVGVNPDIIREGETGFLAATTDQWVETLYQLVTNSQLRATMGSNGRKLIEERFSVASQKEKFLGLFDD